MCYDICKRCGAPHDDGTEDYCMNCLDKKEGAPEGVQELKESICINCAYSKNEGFIDEKDNFHKVLICNNKFCESYCKNVLLHKVHSCDWFLLYDCLHCKYAINSDEANGLILCVCEYSSNYLKEISDLESCDCYSQKSGLMN